MMVRKLKYCEGSLYGCTNLFLHFYGGAEYYCSQIFLIFIHHESNILTRKFTVELVGRNNYYSFPSLDITSLVCQKY